MTDMNNLVIVESPAKARTISKYLGAGWRVEASMGHVRDLPERDLAIDVDHGFKPTYVVVDSRKQVVGKLKSAAKAADIVFLASDPDREGEAIAWHLKEALKLKSPSRIEFHEITKSAVEKAILAPRAIDMDLVNAQQARRVVDRLVGYKISPFLWRRIQKGLSAGRVQSVALRLVVDRENEIRAFVAEESWTIDAILRQKDAQDSFKARLAGWVGRDDKLELKAEADAKRLLEDLEGAAYRVAAVESKERLKQPYLPYITSTLQQDGSSRLRMTPKRTMKVAQELYEGIELGQKGPVGLITYMRTDSTRVNDEMESKLKAYIKEHYGDRYYGGVRKEKAKAGVQGAHECIRPTDLERTPESIAGFLDSDQAKLYNLIWRRFVASRMAAAKYLNTEAQVHTDKGHLLLGKGSVVVFDGWFSIWGRDEKDDALLPQLTVDEVLDCLGLAHEQHFTQPPPRYSEATLIKELEKRGIGRPSTYAATISTIMERSYVRSEDRRLAPTELGEEVTATMVGAFGPIVDDHYTAQMEVQLDEIEEGKADWVAVVDGFYQPLVAMLEAAGENVVVRTGETCPECKQGELLVKVSKFGKFKTCERYPACKYTEDAKGGPRGEAVVVGECPECGKPLVQKKGKFGPFVGCSGYPDCKHIQKEEKAAPVLTGEMCPECGSPMQRREGRYGPFEACSAYPQCKHIKSREGGGKGGKTWKKASKGVASGVDCPKCGKPMMVRKGRFGDFLSCSGYPGCKTTQQLANPQIAVASIPADDIIIDLA
jgi:DNA topoisomerase-1